MLDNATVLFFIGLLMLFAGIMGVTMGVCYVVSALFGIPLVKF